MSLAANPGFQTSIKLRLEILLATMWRAFSILTMKLHRRTGLSGFNPSTVRLMARSVESLLRFRSGLKIQHLARSMAHYWAARSKDSNAKKQGKGVFVFRAQGLITSEARAELRAKLRLHLDSGFSSVRIARPLFSPSALYSSKGRFGLLSGFVVKIRSSSPEEIELASNYFLELESVQGLEFDNFSAWHSTDSDMIKISLRGLSEYISVIESAGDEDFARILCRTLTSCEAYKLFFRQEEVLVRLFLIAKLPLPNQLTDLGWKLLMKSTPSWHARPEVQEGQLQNHSSLGSEVPTAPYTRMPHPSLAVVENVSFFGGDIIVKESRLLEVDPASNPNFSFVAGRQGLVVGTHCNLMNVGVKIPTSTGASIESGILLSSRVDSNWFHWLIETLPKLIFLDMSVPSHIPVIVSKRIPKSALESLRLASSREIVQVSTEESNSATRLFLCSPVIYHPDPVELHLHPTTNTVNIELLNSLRSRLLQKVEPSQKESKHGQSIFVSRNSSSRALVNAPKVEKMLTRSGFDVIDPSQMSFVSQVQMFRSAQRIVLVGGASMANLIFCSKNTQIIILRSKFTRGYKMPEILASLSNSEVISLSGAPLGNLFRNSYLEKVHSHYVAPINLLRRSIRLWRES